MCLLMSVLCVVASAILARPSGQRPDAGNTDGLWLYPSGSYAVFFFFFSRNVLPSARINAAMPAVVVCARVSSVVGIWGVRMEERPVYVLSSDTAGVK